MAYTTLDQLTKKGNSIINGNGLYFKERSFFYTEDILEIIKQDPVLEERIKLINVKFELNDGKNERYHDITILALKKQSDNYNDNDGNAENYHEKVALGWPPYYKRRDEFDDKFPGDPSYLPGKYLEK